MKGVFWLVGAFAAAVAALGAGPDHAPAWKTLEIPKEIGTKQEIIRSPAGWTAGKDARANQLAGLTIFDGPPEENASLVYDSEQKSGKTQVATWRFSDGAGEHFWISCSYAGTAVTLRRELPAAITELRVIYDAEVSVDGLPRITKVEYH